LDGQNKRYELNKLTDRFDSILLFSRLFIVLPLVINKSVGFRKRNIERDPWDWGDQVACPRQRD
jgi:hypothetical protein